MIERTCKVLGCDYGPYRDVGYAEAAKKALVEHLVYHDHAIDNLPVVIDVGVTDTESGVTRAFAIEASLRLDWTNPREVSED
jgi:hypothetical protein